MTLDETFPRTARLQRRAQFQCVKKEGKRTMGRHWILQSLPSTEPDARLGVITTRKNGSAHERSRLRRIGREFFRKNRTDLPANDVVLVARTGAASASNDELREELQTLWTRAFSLGKHG